jgi:hypothetical protein
MDNKLDYYLSKIERQLDFHRGLHLFEMEMNPNFTNKAVFLKESQEEYITNLFGNNKNIRESYNREFNNVIVESTFNPKDEVKKFFSFLKENYINEIFNSNVLLEQTPKVTTPVNPTQTNVMSQQAKQYALNIMTSLRKAFDGVGTDEVLAKQTIFKIKDKQTLDFINSLIAKQITPKYPKIKNLKDWINDEMSDIDRNSYKSLWDHLGKLGYKGYNKNDFLAATGKGDVVGAIGAGFTWLKDKGLPWFMEKLRDALGSTAGAILQQLLDYTGVGLIGVAVLWGVLTLFDVSQIISGVGTWAKLIFSVLGLLTAGALAKAVGKFLKPLFKSGGGTLTAFFQKIAKQNWFITYIKPVVGWIGSKVSGAVSLLKQAGNWVVKKLGATTIGGYVTKAAEWLSNIAQSIVKFAGFESKQTTAYLAKKDLQNQGKKIVTKVVTDPLKSNVKSYTKEKVAQGAGYVGGEKAKTAVELGYDVSDLTKKPKDIVKTFKKGVDIKSLNKAGEEVVSTVDKVGDVIDKTKQIASTEPSDNKKVGNGGKFTGTGYGADY